MQQFTAILTAEEDCYGISDGCLIDKFALSDFNSDCKKVVSGEALSQMSEFFEDDPAKIAWLDSFVGQPVTVMNDDKVYAQDGTYLGIYYL